MRVPTRRWARFGSIGVTLALLFTTVAIAPVAAIDPVTMNASIGGTCVNGFNSTGQHLAITLRTANGTFRDSIPDAGAAPTYGGCFTKTVRISDKLRARWSTGSNFRQVTIPDLTIAADRVTDVVTGHAPAGKIIQILYSKCQLSGCAGFSSIDRSVGSNGRYSKDMTSLLNLHGADRLHATYTNTHGDTFGAGALVPYLQLSKPNKVHIECQPDRAVNVTLKSAGGTLRGSRSFAKAGGCATPDGTFRKNGAAVNIAFGNVIRSDLASDAKIVWPHLAVSWIGTAVSVRCLPSSPIAVQVMRGASQAFLLAATADATGHYDNGTTGFAALSNDVLTLTCSTAKGDRIVLTKTVP